MNLRVIQLKKYYLGFSAIMVLISIIFFFTIKLNLGVDFKGGDLLQLQYAQTINKDALNSTLDSLVNEVPQLKNRRLQYSEDNTIVLRTEQLTDAQKNTVLSKLTEKTGKYELVKYDTVGPTRGKELTSNALTALLEKLCRNHRRKCKSGLYAVIIYVIDYITVNNSATLIWRRFIENI